MRVGDVVAGRFTIEDRIEAGGMGTVYRAVDEGGAARVALKVLEAPHPGDEARLVREAMFLASLQHPAIVRYVSHGVTGGGDPYIVMEWLEGEDLGKRLARTGLTQAESLTVARQVAEALAHAHGRGVIHRDI